MFKIKAREYLRKIYGRKYMAFPADEVEMTEYFFWLNDKVKGKSN